MGRPKQLLPFRGSTLAAAVTQTLLEANVSGVVVVTRSALAGRLELPADERVHLAINDDPTSEMIDSIRLGLATLAPLDPQDEDGVLVVPGDMPTLSAESCGACIAAYAAKPRSIVVATHAGRRGHPIIFPFAERDTVDHLEGGLRMLPRLHSERVILVELNDPGVQIDVDTTDDYRKL